jgi:hypothetical protein
MSEDHDHIGRDSRKIVLTYRREDSSGYAGRLYDELVGRYGVNNVFIDIDSLALASILPMPYTRHCRSVAPCLSSSGRVGSTQYIRTGRDVLITPMTLCA